MSLSYDNPVTLAEFESLLDDSKEGYRTRALIHTIRDYMPFFDQGIVVPANDGTTDKGKIITGYPEGQLRGYNEGWKAEVATGIDVRFESSMVRTRSVVDIDLYEQQPADDRAEWRLRKDQAFMRGLAKSAVKRVFYGSKATNARDMDGLYNIVKSDSDIFSDRIIKAGGTTANKQASIWVVNWDQEGAFMFHPQNGSSKGLRFKDKGEQYVKDKNGDDYLALVTEFAWDLGLAVYNPENVVRIANIDTTKLSKSNKTTGSADLVDLLTQALEMLPDAQSGRTAIYMNDTLRSVLRRQMMNRDNLMLNWSEIAGRKVMAYGEIPIHKLGSDILTNTEAIVA